MNIAVVLLNGSHFSSCLDSGINEFRDEYPNFQTVAYPYVIGSRDPLPMGELDESGAILWAGPRCK